MQRAFFFHWPRLDRLCIVHGSLQRDEAVLEISPIKAAESRQDRDRGERRRDRDDESVVSESDDSADADEVTDEIETAE